MSNSASVRSKVSKIIADVRSKGDRAVLSYTRRFDGVAPKNLKVGPADVRAAYRLGLDNDTIVAMPRIRLLPENNARQGFADAKEVAAICRRLPRDLADAVQFMFITGWRSRSEVLPLTWAQVDFAGGFVRLERGRPRTPMAGRFR